MQILKEHAKPYWRDITFSILAVIVMAGASLWQPRLLQNIMKAIIADNQNQVMQYGIQLLVLAVIGLVAGVINTIFAAKVSQSIAADVRANEYKKIQSFSFGNIEKFSAGNLVVRMTNDVNQVQQLVMMFLQSLTRIPILFVGAFILALMTLPRLWWIVVLMVILIALSSQMVFKQMGKFFTRIQKLIDKTNTLAKENLQGVRVVKSFNQEQNETTRFTENSDELTHVNTTIGYLFSTMIPMFMLISYVAIGAAVLFVGRGIIQHPSDLAAITSFISYLMQIFFAIMIGGMMATFASRGFVSLARIKEVLDTEPDLTYDADAEELELSGDVSFKNVAFTYPGDQKPALENISFDVKSGEMIGIVGATGSGKTTLAQLIARLYDPSVGEVTVGGVNLKHVNEKSLRRAVSYVLQRAILFSGTIAGNLRQGNQGASETELQKAAEIAQAAEFINRYDDNFEHEVEERSANFSGGQKQRLSIARGVVGNPKILILDDSTSALDARSEKLVQEALDRDLKGTTTFVIAEKISSVLHADRILVLDNGQLVGVGSHQELLQSSPIYTEIYETQKAKGANA
ncbi:ABC transporter ATP-binding protein/permease [Leuconostoc falkenbergense]|jgi:ATP-binding cassette, subfamily B, multidrug efflux pump|uniref:ATP-binding cassette domain-containing protein n=1 Tax=Leuconostoc falkenbergense TaxID=2766470 RepID=A0A9X3E8R3_9LACO|nr:ABC transporter ATP-binding protein [Leuconostoc falkenbergense]RDG19304.1 ABC transporter ATP-binding protein [Leuconostoc pseudomesenteroides]MCT4377858.1 ABC transporter ATP-binding protein [Leuconostoc falkenbergense]MCX7578397.1 ATP-binding cassette domain-containing protein [Leuconostoc falkenbergense]MDV3546700.1 ABC transporter ATP-binding protein [Leuconostoc falkenbergense]MDV8952008.1 ATP-binding cassette domain-containing protein [Leuconostoc falkenbergense]